MSKTDRTVVRNESCRRGNLADRYRHNERRNECYGNGDVIPERSHLNVHFKRCEGTYTEAFDRLVADGVISTRGLGKDPKIVDEMVFDVNTAYFDERGAGSPGGGYDYAKKFFAETYKLAVREAGGEEFILSAVLHADERNRAESERLGRDVYHYHLHVMYVPVVDKEIKWSKRCKDPALVGTVREVIKQVSHSKKWPRHKTEGGWVNSYSLLQDRYYDHMKAAGFTGFERGERGSTAEHLTVLDYKIRKDTDYLSGLEQNIRQAENRLTGLQKKMYVLHKSVHTYGEIEQMARKGKTGKMLLEPEDWRTVCDLAKEGIVSRGRIPDLQTALKSARKDRDIYKSRWEQLAADTADYQKAARLAPDHTRAALDEIIRQSWETIRTPSSERKRTLTWEAR